MILVAVRDAQQRESLRAALHREGWQVSVVGSLDSAYRMAADQAPQLVVLDCELPGSEELVKVFARRHGGPGILLLADAAGQRLSTAADAVVARQVDGDELVASVRLCLAAPRPAASTSTAVTGARRWTAEELFGEILEDLDAAVSAVEAAAPAAAEETSAALARGTVPAETLAAPVPRGKEAARMPAAATQSAVEAAEVELEPVVEAAVEAPAEVDAEPLVEPAAAIDAPPLAEPVAELLIEPVVEVAEEVAPPVALSEPVTAATVGSSTLERALADERDRSTPPELAALAEELLELARASAPAASPAAAEEVEVMAEPEPPVGGEAEPVEAPAESAPEAPSEPRLGAYRLVERLSSTEHAEVWQALRDDPEGEATTVTFEVHRGLAARRPEIAARAVAAASQAALLDHPTILPPLDAGLVGEDLFVATEPMSVTTLEQVLTSVRALEVRIPLGLALGMGERVAAALEQAHGSGEGVLHGALHPGNVLLTRAGEVRVTNFAVAAELARDGAPVADRLRYQAPEQIAGEAADPRGDLYSFGAMLFEMVTGRRAFGGEDPAAVAHAIQHDAPDPPDRLDPTIPAEVSGLIARLLKRRREERVQGAGEAQRKLDLALQALPSPPGAAELATWIRQLEEAMRHARPRRALAEAPALAPQAPVAVEERWTPDSLLVPAASALARRRRWLVAALLAAGLALGAVAYWFGRDGAPRVITVPPPAPRPGAALSLDAAGAAGEAGPAVEAERVPVEPGAPPDLN